MLMAPPALISLHDMGNNQRKTIHPERRGNSRQGLDSGLRSKLTVIGAYAQKLMREPGHAVR